MELEDSTFLTSDYTTKLHHRHNMVLAQKQKHRPIEQDRKPRNKPTNLLNLWIVFGSLVIFTILNLFMLNKQGDNIPPWHTPFPIWNQSVVPCRVLIIASWPAYRFLRRQVWWSGICISFSRGSSWPKDQTLTSPALKGRFFTTEPPRKSTFTLTYINIL